jgi:hypothetical protein
MTKQKKRKKENKNKGLAQKYHFTLIVNVESAEGGEIVTTPFTRVSWLNRSRMHFSCPTVTSNLMAYAIAR